MDTDGWMDEWMDTVRWIFSHRTGHNSPENDVMESSAKKRLE